MGYGTLRARRHLFRRRTALSCLSKGSCFSCLLSLFLLEAKAAFEACRQKGTLRAGVRIPGQPKTVSGLPAHQCMVQASEVSLG